DRTGHQYFEVTPKYDALSLGLEDFYQRENAIWVGRPGVDRGDVEKDERERLEKELLKSRCYPIYTGKKENNRFLEGFSNRTIWPLFHYFTQNAVYREEYWNGYVKVNRRYADRIIPLLKEGDKVWIHDYHLMLLPQMIRERFPGVSIGFFLHISFP
ncbi:unnamed protein product, partial [marine sediment metagenome]